MTVNKNNIVDVETKSQSQKYHLEGSIKEDESYWSISIKKPYHFLITDIIHLYYLY